MYRHFLKPILDGVLALMVLILASPVLLTLILLLFIANKGKPFFFQERPGYKGKIFKVIKFKSMNDARNAEGELLPDAKRLTQVGSFVRKTSLDELPQFINVLKGDMSLIGPRPLLPEYLSLYSKEQARRHGVKPGITGWAQVNGRNAISWQEKFTLDVHYVDHQSFWLDLKILFLSVKKVLVSEGISQNGEATMTKFSGNHH